MYRNILHAKMQTSKILTITTNVFLGIIVAYIGLLMLPTLSGLIWGAFNAWIWIAAPTLLLWAKKKEDLLNKTKIGQKPK